MTSEQATAGATGGAAGKQDAGDRKAQDAGDRKADKDDIVRMSKSQLLRVMQNGKHPARCISFDELVKGLDTEIKEKRVVRKGSKQKELVDLVLYNYTDRATYTRGWNVFSLVARGLVLDTKRKRVIATPFPKFFNLGEVSLEDSGEASKSATGDAKSAARFVSSEKMDGSLGIIFHWNDAWFVITRGSFDSEQSQWATAFLRKNIKLSALTAGTTYLAEIVYPENRIVIKYEREELCLLSAYDADGIELSVEALRKVAESAGFGSPKLFEFNTIEEVVKSAAKLNSQQEGFVLRLPSGDRLKVKGDEYIRVHALIANVTPLGVWKRLVELPADAKEALEETRMALPEELLRDFDMIRALIEKKFATVAEALLARYRETKDMTDKDLGLKFKPKDACWPEGLRITDLERKCIFQLRKAKTADVSAAFALQGPLRRAVFEAVRPDDDKLAGYTPSTHSNRFAAAADL